MVLSCAKELCSFSLIKRVAVVRVLVACGAEVIGAEIARQVSVCADVQVMETSDPEAIIHAVAGHLPDVLILHVPTCGCPDERMFRRLQEIAPALRILAVGCTPARVGDYFLHLAPLGLNGCVCQAEGQELQEAIRVLGAGGTLYLCPQASRAILEAYRRRVNPWSRERK